MSDADAKATDPSPVGPGTEWVPVLRTLPRVVNSLPDDVRTGLGLAVNPLWPAPDPQWEADTLRALMLLKAKGQGPPYAQAKEKIDAWVLLLARIIHQPAPAGDFAASAGSQPAPSRL